MATKQELSKFVLNHRRSISNLFDELKFDKHLLLQFLDFEHYNIVEFDKDKIISIRNKYTGELLSENIRIYSKNYKKFVGNVWFDEYLTGTTYNGSYFQNFVRTNSGLYDLEDIIIDNPRLHIPETEPETEPNNVLSVTYPINGADLNQSSPIIFDEIIINGKRYNLIEKNT